jgi:hypothetical protein
MEDSMKSPKKKFPLGRSSFKKVMEGNFYFADKSMLIHDVIENENEVLLFPRPRRFGKTLNLSMLRYFFEKTKPEHTHLFEGLAIQHQETWAHQGTYPVIYLTLKDVKGKKWENCFNLMKLIISDEYTRHHYLIEANILKTNEKKFFESIMNRDANEEEFALSLRKLSEFLLRYHSKSVVILCDEYDSPIHDSYFNGYYDQVIQFMRAFLGSAFKDNDALFKGVLTGILRIARESIFSELNNLDVFSVLSEKFSLYFGITQEEVNQVLIDYELTDHQETIRKCYDGYQFGKNIIYNPWSVTHYFADPDVGYRSYWINTSANYFVKELIFNKQFLKISEIQDLIDGKVVWKELNENIVMKDLKLFRDAVWSLLLFSGYLTAIDRRRIPNKNRDKKQYEYCLKIPNIEISDYFDYEMKRYLKSGERFEDSQGESKQSKKVFISYNHNDINFVKALKKDLENADIHLIIDIESMKFGDDIKEFIEASVKHSDITLSVISENSLKSPWVMLESLETFLYEDVEKKLRFIPVVIDDCYLTNSFYSKFVNSIEHSIDKIADEISKLTKKYLPTDVLYEKNKRLITLRSHTDKILLRLQETLVANFMNDQKYEKNLPQLIRLLKQ